MEGSVTKEQWQKAKEELENKTIEAIQNLTDDEVKSFLEKKWIFPITSAIEALPKAIIEKLADEIISLNEKYAVTYNDIEASIVESEQSLAELIGQLTGDEYAICGLSNLIKK